ncbi:MAG TPA: histidine phosphatase family protein [Bryobacteraceae bacterium]|nr:histidine phosphatase family protein [Bryobacteraceae bacterium]
MSTCLLIRHANTDTAGQVMTGRNPGVHLNEAGVRQARDLANALRRCSVEAIYSSPLERAQETARAISEALGLRVAVCPAFNEFDFGSWSGLSLAQLDNIPEWHTFNRLRSLTPAPGGELMLEAQARVIRALEQLRVRHPSQLFIAVSHADVIRAALAHYLGIPLDLAHRLDIAPASVSVVALNDSWIQVRAVNCPAAACSDLLGCESHHGPR